MRGVRGGGKRSCWGGRWGSAFGETLFQRSRLLHCVRLARRRRRCDLRQKFVNCQLRLRLLRLQRLRLHFHGFGKEDGNASSRLRLRRRSCWQVGPRAQTRVLSCVRESCHCWRGGRGCRLGTLRMEKRHSALPRGRRRGGGGLGRADVGDGRCLGKVEEAERRRANIFIFSISSFLPIRRGREGKRARGALAAAFRQAIEKSPQKLSHFFRRRRNGRGGRSSRGGEGPRET